MFRAIADHNRRKILDILRKYPGISIGDLCEQFPTSRFAVMRHLNILEQAGLIERRQEGTTKFLYTLPGPLLRVVQHWLRTQTDRD